MTTTINTFRGIATKVRRSLFPDCQRWQFFLHSPDEVKAVELDFPFSGRVWFTDGDLVQIEGKEIRNLTRGYKATLP